MDSLDLKTAKMKARLAEGRDRLQSGLDIQAQTGKRAFIRKFLALSLLMICVGLALNGLRYETIRGMIGENYHWQLGLTAGFALWVVYSLLMSAFDLVYDSAADMLTVLPWWRHFSPISFVLFLMLGFLGLYLPASGVAKSLNAILGSQDPIVIDGAIESIAPEPKRNDFMICGLNYGTSYREITVVNTIDGNRFSFDVPDDYFKAHSLSTGQAWKDSIYLGLFGVPYRLKGRWID